MALDNDVDGITYDEKMVLVHNLLVDYEKENEAKRDIINKGQTVRKHEIINAVDASAYARVIYI